MKQVATIQKRIQINAPASKVWAALTTPALLTRWLSDTAIKVESTWQIGSPILFSGELHGLAYLNKGIIVELEAEKRLVYTYWSSLSQVADQPENYTLRACQVSTSAGLTVLELTQSHFPLETIFQHSNFYWNTALKKLKDLVENDG